MEYSQEGVNDEMEKKKTAKALKPLDYVKGEPLDGRTVPAVLKYIAATFGVMVAFLLLGSMMMWNNMFLRVFLNMGLLLFGYLMFYQAGMSSGTIAVNKGEIVWQRDQTGRETSAQERREAYHPLKGFVVSLLGSIPVLLIALGLALTAQKVLTGAGALPEWLRTLERREEIGSALASYRQPVGLTLTDVLRLMIRMFLMPYVNIIGGEGKDALLTLERLSPLLVLIPAVLYGLGYQAGVRIRQRVHAQIEVGKRKIKRRQKRENRNRTHKGPERLN